METVTQSNPEQTANTKFCKHCAAKIHAAAVICHHCGCQVEDMQRSEQPHNAQPNIVINNTNDNRNSNINTNTNVNGFGVRMKNKWVAFFLCLFLGELGIHKFYEERTGMGVLYLFTFGLFGIGWLVDCIILLCKPNPYYVR